MATTPNGFAAYTRKRRKQLGLTQDALVEALTEKNALLQSQGVSIPGTRQGYSRWEQGQTEPALEDLLWVMLVYSDWRMDWAMDGIVAKMPAVFECDGHGLTVKTEMKVD